MNQFHFDPLMEKKLNVTFDLCESLCEDRKPDVSDETLVDIIYKVGGDSLLHYFCEREEYLADECIEDSDDEFDEALDLLVCRVREECDKSHDIYGHHVDEF